MKIYTKTGDDGNTGLQGDFRIAKSHPRILAYGTVDEANAAIGVVLCNELDDDVSEVLSKLQNELFVLGSDLSNQNLNDLKNRISLEMVENLEKIIDWKNIYELIPKFYLDNKMKRTGITGIFAASLELTKEGITKVSQKKQFHNMMIKKS